MSSIPGYKLEEFVAWNYNIQVEGLNESNVSLGMAEMLALTQYRRPILNKKQFEKIMKFWEVYRQRVEDWLLDFDEETQSWRMYGCYPPVEVAEFENIWINLYIDSIIKPAEVETLPIDVKSNKNYRELTWTERIMALRNHSALAAKQPFHRLCHLVSPDLLDSYRIAKYTQVDPTAPVLR